MLFTIYGLGAWSIMESMYEFELCYRRASGLMGLGNQNRLF